MKKYFNSTKGFTLIELLIVIAILGILATAVLSAINPIEQINRGRDTGTQSDAEQLLSAIQRFNASQGYFPWLTGANDVTNTLGTDKLGTGWTIVSDKTAAGGVLYASNGWTEDNAGAVRVLDKLGSDIDAYTAASNELQNSYVTRIIGGTYNHLFVYNAGATGNSTYVCFKPQSGSFAATAKTRCGTAGVGLPADIDDTTAAIICNDTDKVYYVCLP